MKMPERNVCLNFHIDTNRINAKANLRFMNILEHWHNSGVIYIEMAEVAQKEAARTFNNERSEKAYGYVATETLAETPEELQLFNQITAILFPTGIKTRNERNDVEIVFNAHKYYAILVTGDGGSVRQPGGILGNREKLRNLGIQVVRDYEAVEQVKQEMVVG
jgi:hypothetical protein